MNGLVLFVFVDLGGDLYLIAVLVVLHHEEEAHHEGAEQAADVRQGVIVLLECPRDRQGEARFAQVELHVLSGVGNGSGSIDVSLTRLVDNSTCLLIDAFPRPQALIRLDRIGGDENVG